MAEDSWLPDLSQNLIWEILRYCPCVFFCIENLNKRLAMRMSNDVSYFHYFLEEMFSEVEMR